MAVPVVNCGECGKRCRKVGGKEIYPHRPDLYSKKFYLCACGAYCGTHVKTELALGVPAGPETREARKEAHAEFDRLWQTGKINRSEAYEWLAMTLDIPKKDCHIGSMMAPMARRVAELCRTGGKKP